MSRVVLLDSGPIGTLTNPKPGPIGVACERWLIRLRRLGTVVRIPLLADYRSQTGSHLGWDTEKCCRT